MNKHVNKLYLTIIIITNIDDEIWMSFLFVFMLHSLAMTYSYLLVNGLQEFTLMMAYPGTIDLLDQLGVFVDEPGLPQHIGCSVFNLRRKEHRADETAQ